MDLKLMRAALLSLAFSAASLCASGEVEISDFPVNEVYKTASTAYKCVGDTTYGPGVAVYTTASVSLQWPTKFGNNNVKALQDSIVSCLLGVQPASADDVIHDFVTRPIGYGDYKLAPVAAAPAPSDTARVLSKDISVSSVGFCERYIVFKGEQSQYEGGAHPNYFAHFLNYDIKNNRVLTYNTLFKPGTEETLLRKIRAALLGKYHAKNLKQLEENAGIFTDQLFVSREVYLTQFEIVFFYNPYDIGPWAIGSVEVPVIVDDIADCLTPEAKELYGID